MPFQIRQENSTLFCAGTFDISIADELRRTLSDSIDQNSETKLDLSEVTGCDTAGLQLLYAARKQALKDGKRLNIAEVSASIQDAAAALGLSLHELVSGAVIV